MSDGCRCATLTVSEPDAATVRADGPTAHTWHAGEYVPYVPVMAEYAGPYEVTPTATAQTLATEGLAMARDVTIAPIPSNYGLITYNGSTITVS